MLIALVLVGLYVGKDLLVPFVIALVIWYLLNSLNRLFAKIIRGKSAFAVYVRRSMAAAVLASITYFIAKIVILNFEGFIQQYPKYQANFVAMTSNSTKWLDIPFSIDGIFENAHIPSLLSGAVGSSLGFVTTSFLVILYVAFLLIEQRIFNRKLKQIFKDKAEYVRFHTTMRKIDESIHTYISVKTLLCLLAGLLSYIVLATIGVDFAVLWAFLVFLLSYIPIIGALLGIIFPTLIAIVQFGGYVEPFIVICLLTSIQVIIGNFVEPKVLGNRLNLSPLVTIIALTFWGSLWGIAGMFLCVPITVIMMIILNQFEGTRSVAILLSGGKVV